MNVKYTADFKDPVQTSWKVNNAISTEIVTPITYWNDNILDNAGLVKIIIEINSICFFLLFKM